MAGPFFVIDNVSNKTVESQAPTRAPSRRIIYTASFSANESEIQVPDGQLDVSAYRSINVAVRASAWGSATVTIKIYAADSLGNKSTNAILTKTISANGNTLDILAEMGGSTTNATWPAGATAGKIIDPFGSTIVITETVA